MTLTRSEYPGIRHDEREKEAEEEDIRRDIKLVDSSGASADSGADTDADNEKVGRLACVCVCLFRAFFSFFFFIKKTQYPRQIRALNPTLNLAATDGEELNECYGLRHDNASEKRHQIEREVEKARVKDLDPLDAAVEAGGEMGMFFFFFFFFF